MKIRVVNVKPRDKVISVEQALEKKWENSKYRIDVEECGRKIG